MRIASLFVILTCLTTIAGCIGEDPTTPSPQAKVCFSSGDCVVVEIADETPERTRGLMFRQKLAEDTGMLFIFDEDMVQKFWMKNTLISLDMLWIDSSGKIIHLETDVPPCKASPCPTYGPNLAARYVLEVNAGYVRAHDVNIGDTVTLPL